MLFRRSEGVKAIASVKLASAQCCMSYRNQSFDLLGNSNYCFIYGCLKGCLPQILFGPFLNVLSLKLRKTPSLEVRFKLYQPLLTLLASEQENQRRI